MIKEIQAPILKREYRAIPSKSVLHRALILSAFADGPTRIKASSAGEDVRRTAEAMKKLGAGIRETEDGFFVEPIDRSRLSRLPEGLILDCGESATTYRFLEEIVKELGIRAKLTGTERLLRRVRSGAPTSQTISGRMIAVGLRGMGLEMELPSNIVSRPYIELTADVMTAFGGTGYVSPGVYEAEGDWTQAALFLTAAALRGGKTCIQGIRRKSAQGDRRIADYLRMAGCAVFFEKDKVFLAGGKLRGIDVDGAMTPDLVPVLSVIGAFSEGETVIRNIGYLRYKESDRIEGTAELLRALGGECGIGEDWIRIVGKEQTGGLTGGSVNPQGDHRLAMAAAIAAFGCEEKVRIENAECVNKSYPGFWEEF